MSTETFKLDYNTLSSGNKLVVDKFYREKRNGGYSLKEIRQYPRYIKNYNVYISEFNNSTEYMLLDEFFVDETCVWFLYYDVEKQIVRCNEVMLE